MLISTKHISKKMFEIILFLKMDIFYKYYSKILILCYFGIPTFYLKQLEFIFEEFSLLKKEFLLLLNRKLKLKWEYKWEL